ncbi:MAG: NAD(P)H-hydrate dehydratase [Solirubrobacterales bacterium]|nr:NAD(P)H-hydrate dehydratase [Thermoleophilales bacterium]MCO5326433.1 NAD(P)H-hydrate dehydratase [Solirubrobacterales bacterium]
MSADPAAPESQPDWLEPLFDAAGMGAVDRWAIDEQGVPSLELMEAAGAALAREVAALAVGGPVRVVCGKGNNGGDGLVVARLLRETGIAAEALLLWPADELSPDATANLERLGTDGWRLLGDEPALDALAGAGAIVDAIFGTGFAGEPREPVAGVIAAVNELRMGGVPVVACDIPSGVDAATGETAETCVGADATVTFHAPKLGHRIAPGKWRCGDLVVAPIGIPPGAPQPPAGGTIGGRVLALAPRRGRESTKFASGEVIVVGGSRGLTGAVCLASMAAIRAGAGYATAAVPDALEPILETKLTEVMTVGVDSVDGSLDVAAASTILERAERAGAVVLGPGLGRTPQAASLARHLAPRVPCPLLVDADGLNALGTDLASLASRSAPTVLTPHAGELGRLLGADSGAIAARRLDSVRRAADASGAVVVLKGDDTLVASGERLAVNVEGSPALATAGTGDVLSGTIGALLARGMEAFEAACAGVLAHSRAGRVAGERLGVESVIASDVIACLPEGLRADG